ncbi:hypothetical protein B0T21DRAFT_308527 [Apiosordaria backusii]|uniref:Uncharacterized protein n=1 Tax=Apiosordaria backusii TaxID=314023 RepID=A0AA40BSM7_9PEZI|nr:hypothetical protein B0T21DRAFT_308527 [Apiosordaria backusii]
MGMDQIEWFFEGLSDLEWREQYDDGIRSSDDSCLIMESGDLCTTEINYFLSPLINDGWIKTNKFISLIEKVWPLLFDSVFNADEVLDLFRPTGSSDNTRTFIKYESWNKFWLNAELTPFWRHARFGLKCLDSTNNAFGKGESKLQLQIHWIRTHDSPLNRNGCDLCPSAVSSSAARICLKSAVHVRVVQRGTPKQGSRNAHR